MFILNLFIKVQETFSLTLIHDLIKPRTFFIILTIETTFHHIIFSLHSIKFRNDIKHKMSFRYNDSKRKKTKLTKTYHHLYFSYQNNDF